MSRKKKSASKRALEHHRHGEYFALREELVSLIGYGPETHTTLARFPLLAMLRKRPESEQATLTYDLRSCVESARAFKKASDELAERALLALNERKSAPTALGKVSFPERKPRMIVPAITEEMIADAQTFADMWSQILDANVWITTIDAACEGEFVSKSLSMRSIALDLYQRRFPNQVVCLRDDGGETGYYVLDTIKGTMAVCIFCRNVILEEPIALTKEGRVVRAGQNDLSRRGSIEANAHSMTCAMHVIIGSLTMRSGPPLRASAAGSIDR